jgi:hypothetical protein
MVNSEDPPSLTPSPPHGHPVDLRAVDHLIDAPLTQIHSHHFYKQPNWEFVQDAFGYGYNRVGKEY